MDLKVKAPALAAILIGAAAIGMHMGESAIADINPLHFQGAAAHPRERGAAVNPAAIPGQAQAFSDHYGWAQGQSARLADCGDCAALAARDLYASAPVYHASLATRPEPLPARMEVRREPEPTDEPERAFIVEDAGEVERYAYYPIERKPEDKPDEPVSPEE